MSDALIDLVLAEAEDGYSTDNWPLQVARITAELNRAIARIKSEALLEAADVIDQFYFGPDQNQLFSTGAKHKWGSKQAAKKLREMAEELHNG